jgi:hypothetical protein
VKKRVEQLFYFTILLYQIKLHQIFKCCFIKYNLRCSNKVSSFVHLCASKLLFDIFASSSIWYLAHFMYVFRIKLLNSFIFM